MTMNAFDIARCFNTEMQTIVDYTIGRLAKINVMRGSFVKNNEGVKFRITKIKLSYSADYEKARISLYGQKFRKNKTFGKHEHYIGHLNDITVIGSPDSEAA